MEKISVWLIAVLCAGLFITCDLLAANWGKTGSSLSLIIASVLAPSSYILFGYLNKKIELGVAGSLVNIMIVMGAVIFGYTYFHEALSSLQIFGLVLALVAIGCLTL